MAVKDSIKSFHYFSNGDVQYSSFEATRISEQLLPGFYIIHYEEHPHYKVFIKSLESKEIAKDITFRDSEQLKELFDRFFNVEIKKVINNLGYNHKLGILLYGKEGTGKSSIIKSLCDSFVKQHETVVFYVNCSSEKSFQLSHIWKFISEIRRIQNSPIIVIFEEFEKLCKKEESIFKSITDGNLSFDNLIIFATTNYIDEIPISLKDRPSRFKYCFKFDGCLEKQQIINILYDLLDNTFDKQNIELWADELKDYTVDNIKQFCFDKIMNIKSIKIQDNNTIGFKK